VECM